MNERTPRIWVLLGERRGDNNQMLGLAEALGTPFETRTMAYRSRWLLLLRLFPTKPFLLTGKSRRTLRPPWPDLVIGIGRRSVAVARWIKDQSGGRTRIIRLGNPRADTRLFDLVITTAQYPVPANGNVLVLPIAISRNSKPPKPTEAESARLAGLPRPHLLVSLGGTTRYWSLSEADVASAVRRLSEKAAASGGSLIVVSSPRTPGIVLKAIRATVPGCHVIADGSIRYPVLLADADEHYVTADSVSMISEALLTGRPVGLIPVELDEEGARDLGTGKFSSSRRDIRRFWKDLESKGLLGTLDKPAIGSFDNPVTTAAAAVKRLLGLGIE